LDVARVWCQSAVVRIRRVVLLEEGRHGAGLVRGDWIHVAEAPARGVVHAVRIPRGVEDGAFGLEDGFSRVDFRGAYVSNVGAGVGPCGVEDVEVRA
jgi:hypothetical protein